MLFTKAAYNNYILTNNIKTRKTMYKPHVAQSYCLNNEILIYPIPCNKKSFYVEVDFKGKLKKSEVAYTTVKGWAKIWELYEYFYDKRGIE